MWDEIKKGSKWNKTYQCDGADNEEMWERRARVLREKPRYVSQRNPNTGGLGYAVIEKNNFSREMLEQVYNNCIEVVISRDEESCRGVVPLDNGSYIALISRKISGHTLEARRHQALRGILLNEEDMEFFCQLLGEKQGEKFFFPDEFDPEKLVDWKTPSAKELADIMAYSLENWLAQLDYKQVIGLAAALKTVGRENLKVQLVLPMEQQEAMFAAVCCISCLVKERPFVLLNGECPMGEPDILITDEVIYQDNGRYTIFTLGEFISFGLRLSYGLDLRGDAAEHPESMEEEDRAEDLKEKSHRRSLKAFLRKLIKN